ncbi:GDYXXLXY domain-containing protein [Alcaligenes aquatilis]|uniref:GDYXXLXY domain-containing protein n=1 Tax=Alcaligenes aquatilis TaxID=323284 RepID=A0ABY4NHA4_9BURK|nr:GDYXXLXY domain-containing protein [Alcaligenes aquatilis]UQN36171.1 GDYXXLXY domain-containing protein [Alcaligenes aquatilis]
MQVMRPDKTNVWPTDWRVFLTKLAWGLAVLLLASGLVTWIAANWENWGHVAKFALAQGAVLISAGLALLFRRRSGGWGHDLGVPAALTGLAAVATGGLLALIGQTYQTGADPWQLFALWTVLIIPWVFTVRSVFLSVLWLVLINTAFYLWIDVARLDWFGRSYTSQTLLALAVNALLLLAAETIWRARHDPWRIVPRVAAIAVGFFIGAQVMEGNFLLGLVLFLALYGVYRYRRPDLLIMSLASFGAYGSLSMLIIEYAGDAFLLIVVVIVGLGLGLLRFLQQQVVHWRRTHGSEALAVKDDVVSDVTLGTALATDAAATNATTKTNAGTEAAATQASVNAAMASSPAASTAQILANAQVSVHADAQDSDEHHPWYLRVIKLFLYLLLPLIILLYLAVSLDLSLEALGVLGGIMALVAPVLFAKAQTVSSRDLVGGWVACAVLLLSVPLVDMRYPWPHEVSAMIAVVISTLLYRLAKGQFVLRMLLVIWALAAIEFLVIERLFDRWTMMPYWVLEMPAAFMFFAALLLGHLYLRGERKPHFWLPLFWSLLLASQIHLVLAGTLFYSMPFWDESRPYLTVAGFLLAMAPLAILAFYWRGWRDQPLVYGIALLGLAALCAVWTPYPPVALALSWILVAYAWRYLSLLAVAVAMGLFCLWRLYYILNISLLDKAELLLATGVGCLVFAYLGQLGRNKVVADAPVQAAPKGILASVLLGTVLVLGVANVAIVQKERILSDGQTVLLELAPVDPRSLMQGDYMSLNFALSQNLSALSWGLPKDALAKMDAQQWVVVAVQLDENKVAQLKGVYLEQDGQERLWSEEGPVAEPSDVMRLRMRRHRSNWTPGTDAWFFAEGSADRFDAARYGEFAVVEDGQSLLRAMLDKDRKEIK